MTPTNPRAKIANQILIAFLSLQDRAEELTAIGAKDGVDGVREALGRMSIDLANDVADCMTNLVDEVTDYDLATSKFMSSKTLN